MTMTLHELRQRYGEKALWCYIGVIGLDVPEARRLEALDLAETYCRKATKKESPEGGRPPGPQRKEDE